MSDEKRKKQVIEMSDRDERMLFMEHKDKVTWQNIETFVNQIQTQRDEEWNKAIDKWWNNIKYKGLIYPEVSPETLQELKSAMEVKK